MNLKDRHFFWVDALKAFAISGILLNHFVESFGSIPWFSNPSYNWPDIGTRLSSVFPSDGSTGWRIVQFFGWLGDMGPGVFILISGFTLTFSAIGKSYVRINTKDFYIRRLARIFPLYIVIHLLVIGFGVLLNEDLGFDPVKTFLSMLGLRFSDSLFFYINPSWWFIWLILQLYIVFPLLYMFLEEKGIKLFLIVTLGITMISRLAGLLNITYTGHLEYWMTGIFAGTRLSEFAAGMILAKLVAEKRFDPMKINMSTLFIAGLFSYICGFISSLFFPSTLISNTLITLGLTGIFISFSRFIESNLPVIINTVKWIGVVSFPVFLLHQPIMLWVGNDFTGITKAVTEASVIILVFPLGWLIEKSVNKGMDRIPELGDKILSPLIILSLAGQMILNVTYFITGNDLIYKADVVFFLINLLLIPCCFLFNLKIKILNQKQFLLTFIIVSGAFLLLLTINWFSIFWLFILILVLFQFILSYLIRNFISRLIIPPVIVTAIFIVAEMFLARDHPVEVNRWGELPALQKDRETVYSLIPGQTTRLKYNNYDYLVKTNSLGFNGPEVLIPEKKDSNEIRILIIGDAFTMPEGMDYEKAYPELLQAHLKRSYPEKQILVFNGGVTGYGPEEMYASLSKYIDTIKPDIFINQIFINEFEEIRLSSEQRLNSIGLHEWSVREKFFSGSQLPQQLKAGFHRLMNDHSYQRYTYNKSLLQFYETDSEFYTKENISELRNYFLRTKLLCESRNCRYFVMYAPGQMEVSSPGMISYFPWHITLNDTLKYDFNMPLKIYKKHCMESGVPFFDPSFVLKTNPLQPVYFRDSWHWNEEGHRVIASFLMKELQNFIN